MGRHRLEPPRRVRPRVGRIVAAGASLAVTSVALLAAVGVVPMDTSDDRVDRAPAAARLDGRPLTAAGADVPDVTTATTAGTEASSGADPSRSRTGRAAPTDVTESVARSAPAAAPSALPADSGEGRRVVFSMSGQRVWIVAASGRVVSTYLVSGSLTDNLDPGSYQVYSRSRWAVGVDDSGVMEYFVRFAHGRRAAIGFHSIPTKGGRPLQTEAQLGTPQSHGCIRQRLSDAQRMWAFAREGTGVVVVA